MPGDVSQNLPAADLDDEDERILAHRLYVFTRPQLIEAITHLEAYPAPVGPGHRLFIMAESMADAIIEALAEAAKPVHSGWPFACGDLPPGELWTGNLDRVTCDACRAVIQERARFRRSLRGQSAQDGAGQ